MLKILSINDFYMNNLHNSDFFAIFALSNIHNNLNYFKMKRFKKNFSNLLLIADSIIGLKLGYLSFVFDFSDEYTHSVRLFSSGRCSIGISILSMIPSNYSYCLNFVPSGLYLTIWYE